MTSNCPMHRLQVTASIMELTLLLFLPKKELTAHNVWCSLFPFCVTVWQDPQNFIRCKGNVMCVHVNELHSSYLDCPPFENPMPIDPYNRQGNMGTS